MATVLDTSCDIRSLARITPTDSGRELAFREGPPAVLSLHHPDYAPFVRLAQSNGECGRPVGILVDPDGLVVDLNTAHDTTVRYVRDDEDGRRLRVAFWGFSSICYLPRDHPAFGRVRSALAEAAASGQFVWLANRFHPVETDGEVWLQILDARPVSRP